MRAIAATVSLILLSVVCGCSSGSPWREELAPRDFVLPDQTIDRTFRRAGTFFEELAVHVELASPFCPALRTTLAGGNTCSCQSALALGIWIDRSKIDAATRERLAPLLSRHLERLT